MYMYTRPVVIAEIGCNHGGSLDMAKKMIKIAFDCGATYVKFQKRNNKYLLGKKYTQPHPVPENSFGKNYGSHREYLEFSIKEHEYLFRFCNKIGIKYSTSVWEKKSAESLIKSKIKLDFIKVPSACNLDYELLNFLADRYFGKIHISLGMTTGKEIENIVNFFETKSRNKDLVLYACTSAYPCPISDIYVLEINKIIDQYKNRIFSVAFSGHHLGIAIDIGAYVLGAKYIERHFTLDRSLKGTDHSASLEPSGLAKLCRDLENMYLSLKYKNGIIVKSELNQRKKLKRFLSK